MLAAVTQAAITRPMRCLLPAFFLSASMPWPAAGTSAGAAVDRLSQCEIVRQVPPRGSDAVGVQDMPGVRTVRPGAVGQLDRQTGEGPRRPVPPSAGRDLHN